VRNGAQVINMSLGAPQSSQAERAAIDRAAAAGVLVVAAAGNENTSAPSYPAAYPTVISVAAIDAQRNRAWFSNYGSTVSVSAPGVDVLSSLPMGTGMAVEAEWNGQVRLTTQIDGSADGDIAGRIVACGVGSPGEFPASVRGNIAHIRRGTLSFSEKVANAKAAGARGVILSNNTPGLFSGMLTAYTDLVVVAVSQADGDDLLAGGEVSGAVRQVATDYMALNGTSMASPHVAGIAALLVSAASPERLTPDQLRAALESTAEDLGTAGRDDYFGNGLAGAGRALDSLGLSGMSWIERMLRIAGGLEAATPADAAAAGQQAPSGIGLPDAIRMGRR